MITLWNKFGFKSKNGKEKKRHVSLELPENLDRLREGSRSDHSSNSSENRRGTAGWIEA